MKTNRQSCHIYLEYKTRIYIAFKVKTVTIENIVALKIAFEFNFLLCI